MQSQVSFYERSKGRANTQERRHCDGGRQRDWQVPPLKTGGALAAATRSWKRQGASSLEPPEGAWPS